MSCAGVGGVTSLGMAGLQPGSPPQWQCLHAEKTMNRVLKQIAILDLSGLQFINNDSHRHYTICFYVHFIELNPSHSQRKKKKKKSIASLTNLFTSNSVAALCHKHETFVKSHKSLYV